MLKKILLSTTLFVAFCVQAQDYDFGEVSKEELEEKFHPTDSTADAAYLYKYRKTYYEWNNNKGLELINEYVYRIKIYNKDGFKYGTFKLPYVDPESGDSEKIMGLKAYTYNLDEKGKIDDIKVSKSDIFDEKVNKFRRVRKVTMPDLKEGSVVELKYRLVSPYLRYIDQVNFQYAIPVKKLDIHIERPDWYVFAKKNKGYYLISPEETRYNGSINIRNKVRTTTRSMSRQRQGNTVSTSYENNKVNVNYVVDKYSAENIPALKDDEAFVYDVQNYRGGVKYECVSIRYPNQIPKNLSTSWEKVTSEIYKSSSFGGELSKTKYFEKDIDALIASLETDGNTDRILAVFNFVKNKVKWNGYNGKFTDKGVKEAYKENTGNVAEINLMLTAMLRYAKLNADPVLVSSKGNGMPLFPTLNGFNYVISMVRLPDNTFILLDATEKYSLPNVLPVRALNWKGRAVLANGNSGWINLTSSKHATEENLVLAKLSDDLSVEGLVRTKYENLNALNFRKNYNHIKEDELIGKFEESNSVEVDNFKITNQEELYKPVVRSVKFSSEDLIEQINDKIYIEPLLFLTKRANPFKQNERKFPVDFISAWEDTDRVTLEIPEGYKVASVPEAKAIALPDNIGVFKYQVIQAGNKLKTLSTLRFNAPMIPAEYYTYLKDFYTQVVEKETEKIVLEKI